MDTYSAITDANVSEWCQVETLHFPHRAEEGPPFLTIIKKDYVSKVHPSVPLKVRVPVLIMHYGNIID